MVVFCVPGDIPGWGPRGGRADAVGCLTGSPGLILGLPAAALRSVRGSQIGASCRANRLPRQVALLLMPQRVPDLGRQPGQLQRIRR